MNITNNHDEVTMDVRTYRRLTDLQQLIDATTSGYPIVLYDNYAYDMFDADDNSTFNTYTGVIINKTISIVDYNFGAYEISGAGMVKIFNITSSATDVRFEGLNLIFGRSNRGAAITDYGNGLTVVNCTFDSNHVDGDYGGAIFIGANDSNIVSSNFFNNNVSECGGAIGVEGANNVRITNSTFINNYVPSTIRYGGALGFISSSNINVNYNVFIDNRARERYGHAIYSDSVTAYNINDNWFGSNDPRFSGYNSLISGALPTSWIVLRLEIYAGSVSVASTRASWYSYNNITKTYTKINTTLPTRNIIFESNLTAASQPGGVLDTVKTINDYTDAAYWYSPYTSLFYINATVDNQTVGLTWNTVLNVTKTVDRNVSVAGDDVYYNLTIINWGPNVAYNVTVREYLPSGFVMVNASDLPYSQYYNVFTYIVPSIGPNSTYSIPITLRSTTNGTIYNHFDVIKSDPYNWFVETDAGVNHTVIPGVDLQIEVTNTSTYITADYYIYVTVRNLGPCHAYNVTADFVIPPTFNYISYSNYARTGSGTTYGNYYPTNGTWEIGTIGAGGYVTIRIRTTPTTLGFWNTTAKVRSDVNETKLANNFINLTYYVTDNTDVELTVTPRVGGAVNYTPYYQNTVVVEYFVRNYGPAPAGNVSVNITLPPGLKYVSDTSGGAFNVTNGTWTIGTLPSTGTNWRRIYVTCIADQVGNFTGYANATGSQNDTNLSNNYVETNITIKPYADLRIFITANETYPSYDSTNMRNFTYTITIYNAGLNNATQVNVSFIVPTGFVYLDHTFGVPYNETTGIWSVGNLSVGETQEVNITVGVNTTGIVVASTNITGYEDDLWPNNNHANVTVRARNLVDLSIEITSNLTHVFNGTDWIYEGNDGDNATYIIKVTNNGPMDAHDVNITNFMTNLQFIACNASGIYYLFGQRVTWSLGNISAGDSVYVHFNATLVAPLVSYVYNNASVVSDDNDVNYTDNTYFNTTHILHFADLEVNMTLSNDTPGFHDLIVLNVTVTNYGPSVAVNTSVNISIPAGLTVVSSSSGNFNAATGIWTIGLLNSTSPYNVTKLTLVLNVTDIGEMIINSTVTNDITETNPPNNNASINLTAHPSAYLLVIITDNIVGDIDMGSPFVLYVNATNRGPSNATNVNVTIVIPPGLITVADNSSGAYSNITGIWDIGNLNAGESKILMINLTSVYANTYYIYSNITGNESDPQMNNNNYTRKIVIRPVIDLSINVTANRFKTPVNETINFTITVHNAGPSNATDVNVTGLFDPSFVVSPTVWHLGQLNAGNSFVFNVIVNCTQLGLYTSYFNVTGYGNDTNMSNNYASAQVNVTHLIDLLVTIVVDNSTPSVGGNITYLITVSNKLPTTATDVRVELPIPTSNLTYLESFVASGSFNPSPGLWYIGTLGGGNSTSMIVTTQVISYGTTNLVAFVDAAEFDNYTADNTDNAIINAINGSLPGTVDLVLNLTVNDTTPYVGEYVTFTANLTNIGLANATGVTVKFDIPADLTDVTTSSTFFIGDTWHVGNLKIGDSVVLTITGKPANTNNITVTGNASSNQIDSNITNNIDNATIMPQPSTDLEINITVNNTTPYLDDNIIFTITVTNIGFSTATGVYVNTSSIPPTPFSSYSPGTLFSPATGLWSIGTINVGDTKELNITLNVTTLGAGYFTFPVNTSGTVYETNYTNNYADVNVTVKAPTDIFVDISANTTVIYSGDSINFTVNVTNIGLGVAEDVFIQLDFPSSVNYLASKGLFDTNKSLWSVGNLSIGESQVLNIVFGLTTVGSYIYTANGTTSTLDTNLTNNNDTFNLTVKPSFDLTITLEVINTTVNMNEPFNFTITVNNTGVGTAENVKVYTDLPGTDTFLTKGTYNTATKEWTIGNVTPGEVLILNLTYTPTTVGNFTYKATVNSTEYERNKTNTEANITIEVINAVDLSVTITVDNSTPSLGQSVKYNITVSNNGINTANSVTVLTNIISGTPLPGYPPFSFVNTAGNLSWYIISMAPGTNYSLIVEAPVTKPGIMVTTAKVNSTEIELNDTDNNDSVELNVSTDTDLAVTINVTNTTPYVGDIVNFTIHVTNLGFVNATNVELTTNLPIPVTYTLTKGLYNPLNGIWLIDNLPNGTDAYLVVSVNITKLGYQVYNVTANMTNEDINWTNNNDTVNLTSVSVVDLEVKIIGNTTFYEGNTTTFTIIVFNNGPNDATDVNVTLNLPEDSFAPPSAGSYSSGLWNVGNLNAGDNATLTITRTLQFTDTGIYVANATGAEFEFITTNNNDSINITVYPVVDLEITISTPNTNYVYGEEVIYTITVNNKGPANLTNANVTLDLPLGYYKTFNMSNNGAYYNDTTWYIGTLNTGMPAILTIRGTINQTGNLTSKVHVVSDVYELNETDNYANCSYVVAAASDLSINLTLIPTIFNPDGTVGFNVSILNAGPTVAQNVTVNVSFPVSFSYNTTIGYYDSANQVWFIPTLDVGNIENLIVNINLTNFTDTFFANISSDVLDQNMSNNYANLTLNLLPLADLQVTITANTTTPNLGDNVTFFINITNLGPCIAPDVFVNVDLPISINYTATRGLFDTSNGTWDVGTLNPGESHLLAVVIPMTAMGTYTYTANTSGDVNDTNLTNNRDNVTVIVQPVTDIEVIITSNATNIYIGDVVNFNVTIINHGAYSSDVETQINLPAGISLPPTITFTNPPSSFNPFTYLWTVNGLAGGTNQTCIIYVTILSNGTYNISASANGTLADTNMSNNNATLFYNVSSVIDLQINLTATNTSQYVGENVTFTITVTNIGLHKSTNTYINTTIPKGQSVKTDGIFDADTGLWYVGEILPGQVIELNVTVINNITGPATYTAEVKSNEKDANYADNNATLIFTGLNSTDLSITVSVNNDHPYLNDIVNYTITIRNNGVNIANNVIINTTIIDNGFEFIAADTTGYNNITGIWTIGTLNPGDTQTLTFTYKTNVSGTFTNEFNVSSTTYDLNLNDNTVNQTIVVNTSVQPVNNFVDLIVNITASNTTVAINSTVYFNVSVYNNASITAHNVTIKNFLPAGFVITSANYGNVTGSGVWEFDQLAPGVSISVEFAANITSYGSFVDNVTVESLELDRVPIDNRANVLIVVGENTVDSADIEINVTQISSNITLNGTVTYNITVINNGVNNVNNANTSIRFDTGLVIENYTISQGTFDNTTGEWDIGNITVGNSVTMEITINITRYGYFVNTFSAWSEYVDSNPLNNNVVDIFQLNNTIVDVGIRIKANNTAPVMNDTISFEVTVYNSGVLPATNVTVNITWPENITDINITDPAYNNTTSTYYIGDLANGTSITFTFTAVFNSTSPTTILVAVNSTEPDRYMDNNYDNITIVPRDSGAAYADLAITSLRIKSSKGVYPQFDDTVELEIIFTNRGPDTAHNVYLPILLPDSCFVLNGAVASDNITYINNLTNASGSKPAIAGWYFPVFDAGRTENITFSIQLNEVNNFIMNVTMTGDEIDLNVTDNVASIGLSPFVPKPNIDLDVVLSAPIFTTNVNKTITFTLTVTNRGNDTAENVTIANILPSSFTLLSVGLDYGVTYDYTNNTWFTPSILDGASVSLNFTVEVTQPGVFVTTVTANCSQEDADPTNNVAAVGIYASVPNENATEVNTTLEVLYDEQSGGKSWIYGDYTNYYAKLTRSDNGNPIEGQAITLNIRHKTQANKKYSITAITDSNGIATFKLTFADLSAANLAPTNAGLQVLVNATYDTTTVDDDKFIGSVWGVSPQNTTKLVKKTINNPGTYTPSF